MQFVFDQNLLNHVHIYTEPLFLYISNCLNSVLIHSYYTFIPLYRSNHKQKERDYDSNLKVTICESDAVDAQTQKANHAY